MWRCPCSRWPSRRSDLGAIGRLGGIGAKPAVTGPVPDGDGALTAIACALKLGDMAQAGDHLPGDVLVSTHICPHAPVIPHDPVPLVGAQVDMAMMNCYEVDPAMRLACRWIRRGAT